MYKKKNNKLPQEDKGQDTETNGANLGEFVGEHEPRIDLPAVSHGTQNIEEAKTAPAATCFERRNYGDRPVGDGGRRTEASEQKAFNLFDFMTVLLRVRMRVRFVNNRDGEAQIVKQI